MIQTPCRFYHRQNAADDVDFRNQETYTCKVRNSTSETMKIFINVLIINLKLISESLVGHDLSVFCLYWEQIVRIDKLVEHKTQNPSLRKFVIILNFPSNIGYALFITQLSYSVSTSYRPNTDGIYLQSFAVSRCYSGNLSTHRSCSRLTPVGRSCCRHVYKTLDVWWSLTQGRSCWLGRYLQTTQRRLI